MAGILLPLIIVEHLVGLGAFTIPFVASTGAIAPAAPLVRPRSIALGSSASASVSLTVATVMGPSVHPPALAAVVSIALMALLKAPHVPAVAAAAVIGLSDPGARDLLDPLLPAVASVIVTALLIRRFLPKFGDSLSWR